MKTWDEAKEGIVVYVKEPIEFEDENGHMQFTKPFQKSYIDESLSSIGDDCTSIVIDGGIADGYDFYFYHKESSPGDLLTSSEYKEFKKKKFEILENGNKRCSKCGAEVLYKWTHAFEKEWCPNCGYGIVK